MLERLFNICLTAAVAAFIIVLILKTGPDVEAKLLPPIAKSELKYVSTDTVDSLYLSGSIVLKRDCTLKRLNGYVLNNRGNIVDKIRLKILNRNEVITVNESTGEQIWTAVIQVPKNYVDLDNDITITATYSCHNLWDLEYTLVKKNLKKVMDHLN